jgi:hypothetical protein
MPKKKFIDGQYKLNLPFNEDTKKALTKCAEEIEKDEDVGFNFGTTDDETEWYLDFKITAYTINECRAKRNVMKQILRKVCNFEVTMEMEGSCI